MRRPWADQDVFVEENGGEDTITVRLPNGSESAVRPTLEHLPEGLLGLARHVGVAADPTITDFSVVRLPKSATTAAVYTRNLCVSPAIVFDRENTNRGLIQLVCVISKNACVFTPTGRQDIERIAGALAQEFDVRTAEILISCTGVIGRPLPVERIVSKIPGIRAGLAEGAMDAVSNAILTTDKRPKCASIRVGDVVVGGYAKGAGMIEPNMATMLVYLYTNATIEKADLDRSLKHAVDRTFNAMSVDTDTSTSDTVALMATGAVIADRAAFDLALTAICLKLSRSVAREAEGATKLVEVSVSLATSPSDAMFFAKKIVNSPLIKTAIHGADPNWGRIVMAIGKPSPGSPLLAIDPADVVIAIQGRTLYDRGKRIDADLSELSQRIKAASEVRIQVTIGSAVHTATAWGCDLSAEYVHENAHYTT
ncbi:MAG TPA: bifunctional glutamate N-acetyltransferase/amino-acid acetyltransferase ArgJ [Polyangiaceae bacterium]|nr:bifunctional glutamate N-acetyltransferase/amino-acid acetyltransferase ArgJ [Polyangiaceae bacterium]